MKEIFKLIHILQHQLHCNTFLMPSVTVFYCIIFFPWVYWMHKWVILQWTQFLANDFSVESILQAHLSAPHQLPPVSCRLCIPQDQPGHTQLGSVLWYSAEGCRKFHPPVWPRLLQRYQIPPVHPSLHGECGWEGKRPWNHYNKYSW